MVLNIYNRYLRQHLNSFNTNKILLIITDKVPLEEYSPVASIFHQ